MGADREIIIKLALAISSLFSIKHFRILYVLIDVQVFGGYSCAPEALSAAESSIILHCS